MLIVWSYSYSRVTGKLPLELETRLKGRGEGDGSYENDFHR